MEECSSLRSSDSAGTSEEYEIIDTQVTQVEPQLNIANNGNMEDLQQELTEVCALECILYIFIYLRIELQMFDTRTNLFISIAIFSVLELYPDCHKVSESQWSRNTVKMFSLLSDSGALCFGITSFSVSTDDNHTVACFDFFSSVFPILFCPILSKVILCMPLHLNFSIPLWVNFLSDLDNFGFASSLVVGSFIFVKSLSDLGVLRTECKVKKKY